MPWCPKCRSEYRKGFTVCADCGSTLVDELPAETKNEDSWDELAEQGISSVGTAEEIRQAMDNPDSAAEMIEMAKQLQAVRDKGDKNTSMYQDSSDRASDNRSSAWILLILGFLGIIAVILGMTGVLPISFGNSYLFYGVMGAMFILFIVGGFVSMKNAKLFEKQAESENSLKDTLLDWCRENLDGSEIDKRVGRQGEAEEVLYLKRFAYIKAILNHQFVNLDQGFLDKMIDDYIYDLVYEK